MTDLVISAPHLQTSTQRLGALVVTVLGWLLWCYLAFPLVTLLGWLFDIEACSQWVNLSGGYLNLKEMLAVYGLTILAMAALWAGWSCYNQLKWRPQSTVVLSAVNAVQLSEYFAVSAELLEQCQRSRYVVVRHDNLGRIVALEHRKHAY